MGNRYIATDCDPSSCIQKTISVNVCVITYAYFGWTHDIGTLHNKGLLAYLHPCKAKKLFSNAPKWDVGENVVHNIFVYESSRISIDRCLAYKMFAHALKKES